MTPRVKDGLLICHLPQGSRVRGRRQRLHNWGWQVLLSAKQRSPRDRELTQGSSGDIHPGHACSQSPEHDAEEARTGRQALLLLIAVNCFP